VYKRQAKIEASKGPEFGLEKIRNLVTDVINDSTVPVRAIGIGSTGPLDRDKGAIQNPYTLPGWEDVSIVDYLQEHFRLPTALENDADAAALGEAWMGAGRDAGCIFMVTVGTGVGTAMIQENRIYRGVNGAHPEGGHILIDPSGPECYCGARGCLESLVSGPAIAELARKTAAGMCDGYLQQVCNGDLKSLSAAQVFDGARAGDETCRELVKTVSNWLGLGLVSIMMLNLPEVIILGGGVMRSYDLMEPYILQVIQKHDIIIPTSKVRLSLAGLGQQAGIFGAARAAFLHLSEGNL
jgi:glucokinase